MHFQRIALYTTAAFGFYHSFFYQGYCYFRVISVLRTDVTGQYIHGYKSPEILVPCPWVVNYRLLNDAVLYIRRFLDHSLPFLLRAALAVWHPPGRSAPASLGQ